MSTFTNFTITVPFANFSAENWEALVKNSTNPENTSWDEVEMLMLRNAHRGTTHTLKNYVDQVLNGAINHYNGALATTYNRIATLEAEGSLGETSPQRPRYQSHQHSQALKTRCTCMIG